VVLGRVAVPAGGANWVWGFLSERTIEQSIENWGIGALEGG